MSKKNEYKDNFPERFTLTDKGQDECIKMLEGANPSELGFNFAKAAVMLGAFRLMIEKGLKENPPNNQEPKTEIIELLEETKDLMKKYMDAARLTREFPD